MSAVLLWSVLAFGLIAIIIEACKNKGKSLFYYMTTGRKNYLKLETLPLANMQKTATLAST
jgi:hypothetical protein